MEIWRFVEFKPWGIYIVYKKVEFQKDKSQNVEESIFEFIALFSYYDDDELKLIEQDVIK